jgi:hypothetical protein
VVAKQKQRCAKENIMAELKILGRTLKEIGDAARARRRDINESFLSKTKTSPGDIASRVDFSDEKMGPKFKADTKPVKKITKENGDAVTYLNSGDWVENSTSLEYNFGKWTLYKHDPTSTEIYSKYHESKSANALNYEQLFEDVISNLNFKAQ